MKYQTNKKLLQKLVNIGLTKQEAVVYLVLLNEGVLNAKEISKRLNILPNVVYRTATNLQKKKLINTLTISPITYQVISPTLGLSLFAKEKTFSIEQNIDQISKFLNKIKKHSKETRIEMIFGKYETYLIGKDMANNTRKEFLVISIGEQIPQDLLLAVNKAHKRGVILRLIVHKYNNENKEILDNFKKNGYEIRYHPDWGFHLTISDNKEALLIVNNPKNPKERVGMQIFSQGLAKALRDYFYSVWKKAEVI